MRTYPEWLNLYAISHQNKINQRIHLFCVPAILFSLLGLLAQVRWESSPFLSLASLLCLPALGFYLRLGWAPFGLMLAQFSFFLAMVALVDATLPSPSWWYGGIFLLAWIGQAIGHKVEGKKPSFFEDIQFLLIGPLWVFKH